MKKLVVYTQITLQYPAASGSKYVVCKMFII